MEAGHRFPDNIPGHLRLTPPAFLLKKEGSKKSERQPEGIDGIAHSVWFSTDPFSTVRWKPEKPFGVVVAASLGRAIHPTVDRNFTWRELARYMSLPDTWSLRKLIEQRRDAELGKAVPSASGKWIAHWAKMAIEGTPGEFAGIADETEPLVRTINVRNPKMVEEIRAKHMDGNTWESPIADPDPAIWIFDRKVRPREWLQAKYEDQRQIRYEGDSAPKARKPRKGASTAAKGSAPSSSVAIQRIAPEAVQAVLDDLGLSKADAAEKLGVSTSRINEMTGHTRPGSHLNADRWESVQATLRA